MYWFILLFYIFLLIYILLLERGNLRSVNLIPFNSIIDYIMVDNGIGGTRIIDVNIWGNILMFIPAGIYIMVHTNHSKWKNLLILIGVSIGVEIAQYVFAIGATDIDDVILNSVGAFLGILIYTFFLKVFKTREKIKKAISIFSVIIGILVFVLFLILIIYNL